MPLTGLFYCLDANDEIRYNPRHIEMDTYIVSVQITDHFNFTTFFFILGRFFYLFFYRNLESISKANQI